MHLGVIPATGKSFKAAHEHCKAALHNGKIIAWAMEPTESAGLMAILGQFGVKIPVM
jgi:hypothetical protein